MGSVTMGLAASFTSFEVVPLQQDAQHAQHALGLNASSSPLCTPTQHHTVLSPWCQPLAPAQKQQNCRATLDLALGIVQIRHMLQSR